MLFMDKQWVVLFLITSISVDSCWSAEDPDLSFRDQLSSSMLNLGVEGRSLEAALNHPLLDWVYSLIALSALVLSLQYAFMLRLVTDRLMDGWPAMLWLVVSRRRDRLNC